MDKSILDITGEALTKGKIPIDIYKDAPEAFMNMAKMMIDEIVANNKEGKRTLFITPLGPVAQYDYFVKTVNENRISLKNVTFINMDEYMLNADEMIDANDELSFRRIMNEKCYSKIDKDLIMPMSQRIFPTKDNAKLISAVIADHGGVDICFGGIGINGHMAFNEPPEENSNITEEEYKNLSVRVQKISRETLIVNSLNELHGAYYFMPKYCVTIGIKEIIESKKVRLFCFKDLHRSVVRRASFGDKSISFPASLLQDHCDARIGISAELAK